MKKILLFLAIVLSLNATKVSAQNSERMQQMQQAWRTFLKDSVLLIKKNYNLITVLEVLEQYMKVVGINSDHRIEDDGKHIYVIQHRLGENWSLFIKEFLILLFENLGKVKVDISSTQNTTVAKVFINL